MAEVVRAAGGLVWRWRGDREDEMEVVLVHRPRYDDWTIPKGKLDPGESDERAALREVEEETGLRCRRGPELASVDYLVDGRPKRVRYWAMTVETETPREPDHEVDAMAWLAAGEAEVRLTYEHDRMVLRSLLDVVKGV